MKIHITSCFTGPDTYRLKETRLRELYASSVLHEHELVESPESADLIMVGNLRDEDHWDVVLNDQLLARYPDKCFGISDHDTFPLLIHGIYTSARRSHDRFGRARSGCYALTARKNVSVPKYAGRGVSTTKRYLSCFVGNCETHAVRKRLLNLKFKRPDTFVEDTSRSFQFFKRDDWADNAERLNQYCESICESKFSLCPRGYGTASIRLFETMELGVAPVIIADDWLPPAEVPWKDFAIFVRESDVGSLEAVLEKNEHRFEELGRRAHKAYNDYFSAGTYFNYLVRQCCAIQRNQILPEGLLWQLRRLGLVAYRLRKSRWAQRSGFGEI